jgi:hypothetical protein
MKKILFTLSVLILALTTTMAQSAVTTRNKIAWDSPTPITDIVGYEVVVGTTACDTNILGNNFVLNTNVAIVNSIRITNSALTSIPFSNLLSTNVAPNNTYSFWIRSFSTGVSSDWNTNSLVAKYMIVPAPVTNVRFN